MAVFIKYKPFFLICSTNIRDKWDIPRKMPKNYGNKLSVKKEKEKTNKNNKSSREKENIWYNTHVGIRKQRKVMDMKKLPYGISDYERLIENDYYYVDKTMYMQRTY